MPGQKRSRQLRKAERGVRSATAEQRELIRVAASEREEGLAALSKRLMPQARAIREEYIRERRRIWAEYEERRTGILAGETAEAA